jgi:hypothetical protein
MSQQKLHTHLSDAYDFFCLSITMAGVFAQYEFELATPAR